MKNATFVNIMALIAAIVLLICACVAEPYCAPGLADPEQTSEFEALTSPCLSIARGPVSATASRRPLLRMILRFMLGDLLLSLMSLILISLRRQGMYVLRVRRMLSFYVNRPQLAPPVCN